MTDQEALNYLISMNIIISRGNGKRRFYDAIVKAIFALSKRISKKPDTETKNRGIDVSGEYDIDSNYICPSCKSVVGDYELEDIWYKYCPECGQALDWS